MGAPLTRLRGFTIVELLVVIAIMGMLVGLLIPAVQASREAARRTECTNNLKQFGLAFLSFESQNRAFPAGLTARLYGPIISVSKGQMHGFMIDLLPYIEEGSLDALYDHNAMFFAPQNAAAIATPIGIALCPSSPGNRSPVDGMFKMSNLATPSVMQQYGPIFNLLDSRYSGQYRGAITDYAVPVKAAKAFANSLGYNVTDGFAELQSMFPLPSQKDAIGSAALALVGPSVFEIREQTRARQITDGLSHTFMMTEAAGRPQHWQAGNHTTLGEPLECAWANPLGMGIFINGDAGGSVLQQDNNHQIYSFHSSGVNFLFADGHVDLIPSEADARLILALMTPSRGEIFEKR